MIAALYVVLAVAAVVVLHAIFKIGCGRDDER